MTNTSISAPVSDGLIYSVQVDLEADPKNPKSDSIELGEWRGLAKNKAHAIEQATALYGDDSSAQGNALGSAGSRGKVQVQSISRYISSEGWGHYFNKKTESTTRWVADRLDESCVDAEILLHGKWYSLTENLMDDLLEDLNTNDVFENPKDWEAKESRKSPSWARTPLQIAASRGDLLSLQSLVEAGADIHERNPSSKNTLLHFASTFGATEMCVALLELGVDPMARNKAKLTAAQLAVENQYPGAESAILAWVARQAASKAVAELNPRAAP